MSSEQPQQESSEPWVIDHIYKVVKFKNPIGKDKKSEFQYVEHSTKSKRQLLLNIVSEYESKMQEAIAKNSDVMATQANDDLMTKTIKTTLPGFPITEAEEDETLGMAMLGELAKDLRSFFLAIGGTQRSKLLHDRASQMQSMLTKLKDSEGSKA